MQVGMLFKMHQENAILCQEPVLLRFQEATTFNNLITNWRTQR